MEEMDILIVEDDAMTARLLVYRLNALGHKVKHLDNGVEGLAYIMEKRPDIVILDVMLPGMSGFEIMENVKDSDEISLSALKVIMLTTKGRPEDILRGFNLGALEYIPKPFKMDEFLLRLNRIIQN